ncbi:MAG: hypothetical protein AB1611_12135 [bacterium]
MNPLAAAARYAQAQGFTRVVIVDWDIHHGDGTQSIFANDQSVYCISIHSALDLYMMTMRVVEQGTTTAAEAVGQCNIPLLDEFYKDDFIERTGLPGRFYRAPESLPAFQSAVEHIPWTPELILIFSGYDSHRDDCGRGITDWSVQDYRLLTRYVLDLAKRVSCPVLSVHGGGYAMSSTISSAISHVDVLASYLL